jgi:hypothetical protein
MHPTAQRYPAPTLGVPPAPSPAPTLGVAPATEQATPTPTDLTAPNLLTSTGVSSGGSPLSTRQEMLLELLQVPTPDCRGVLILARDSQSLVAPDLGPASCRHHSLTSSVVS